MKVLVVGVGATGGFFGACLGQAGRDVTFLVRPKRATILRDRGLRIIGLGQDLRLSPSLVTAQELSGHYDFVLLAVKATALQSAIQDFAPAVGASTLIIPFLNGMAHLETLNGRFGKSAVLGGVAKLATTLNENQDIVRLNSMASLEMGEQDGSPSQRLQDAAEVLSVDGFKLSVSDRIVSAMWHKWVFIVSISAVNTLMRGSVGDVCAVPGGATLGPAVVAEAAAISAAAGFPVSSSDTEALTAMVSQPGSALTTSLYRDLTAGLATETETMFGDFIARARTLSVATPLLDLVTMNLRVYEYKRAEKAS